MASAVGEAALALGIDSAILRTAGEVAKSVTSLEFKQIISELKARKRVKREATPSSLTSRAGEKEVQFDACDAPRFICYRGPSTARPRLPVVLTYEPFLKFRSTVASMQAEPQDGMFAQDLWEWMGKGWDDEKTEMSPRLNDAFATYIGRNIDTVTMSGNPIDGLVEAAMILFEHKILLGDGYLQGLEFLRLRFLRMKRLGFHRSHGLFIMIVRPYIQVVAVLMDWQLTKVVAEPLTDLINCFGAWEHEFKKLAVVLGAIRVFCRDYDAGARVDPRVPYMLLDKPVQQLQGKLVYMVDSDRVVKLTTCYSADAHECWAEKNLAPSLLACKPIGAGWLMVEMACLGGKDGWEDAYQVVSELKDDSAALASLTGCISAAAKEGHDTGYVHGDMRLPNIKLRRQKDGGFDVRFVDFDWAGRAGEAAYPAMLNPAIKWHHGASIYGAIQVEHDLHFVNDLVAQLS